MTGQLGGAGLHKVDVQPTSMVVEFLFLTMTCFECARHELRSTALYALSVVDAYTQTDVVVAAAAVE